MKLVRATVTDSPVIRSGHGMLEQLTFLRVKTGKRGPRSLETTNYQDSAKMKK